MNNIPIVFLIMNCYKYQQKAQIQKASWLKDFPDNIYYYHVLGDIQKCNEENSEYIFDNNQQILYVKTEDDYNSLPHKVISSFEAVHKEFNYSYIFKTDDDQMLMDKSLLYKLPGYLNENTYHHYGGFIMKIEEHNSQYYQVHNCLPQDIILKKCSYSNGRFYFLSREAVENLLPKKEEISTHYIEDHAIGYYLDEMYKEKMLFIHSNKIFKDIIIQNN